MTNLRTIDLVLCAAALAVFLWGMMRFFQKPSGHTVGTRLVSGCGAAFAGWDLWAIGMAQTTPWRLGAAMSLHALAIALFCWAAWACRQQPPTAIFERDVPRSLIRQGPYRHLRHPFYVAYTLFWIAGWIATDSWIALAAAVVMFALYASAARREEAKFRASPLAAEHAAYCQRTGFMWPSLRVVAIRMINLC